MTATMTRPGAVKTIAGFFFTNGESTTQKMAEIKALSDEDKDQLTNGILDGSLSY